MLNIEMDLQIFAEGGAGGDAGGETGTDTGVTETNEENVVIPSFIPEKKRKLYLESTKKARSANPVVEEKAHPQDTTATDPTATNKEEQKKTFSELIESDEYKKEREEYLHQKFQRRFSKFDGMEKENATAKELLSTFAEKYGVDSESKSFFEDLKSAMSKDESIRRVDEYMKSHDVDREEAERIVKMESALAEKERQERLQKLAEKERRENQEREEMIRSLRASAEKTKARFPEFNLDTAMQDESFRRMCAATRGDTTAAYIAANPDKVLKSVEQNAAATAEKQIANAFASNSRRPAEGAMTRPASSVADIDISKLSGAERRKMFAELVKTRK